VSENRESGAGARGFEPPTSSSQNHEAGVAGGANASQIADMITVSESAPVQPPQSFAGNTEAFTTRLLPTSGGGQPGISGDGSAAGERVGAYGAPNTAPACATTPTLEQITASLKEEGIDLSTPTLKSYLSRAKAARHAAGERRRWLHRRHPRQARETETSTKPEVPTKSGKDAFLCLTARVPESKGRHH
jgi:hypothetical protein